MAALRPATHYGVRSASGALDVAAHLTSRLSRFRTGRNRVAQRMLCMSVSAIATVIALASARAASDAAFVGASKFERLVSLGSAENWKELPIGQRLGRVGMALAGTPYKNYTLEIHARSEEPCVNMLGMDCWTFFEIALATARALKASDSPTPGELLKLIELDRYRGGKCDGTFTSRLHYLEDWLHDNQRRGWVKDITPSLPGSRRLYRNLREMSVAWKWSPQLRADRSLIPEIAQIERKLSARGIWFVPKRAVPAAEGRIHTGDIVSIVTTWPRSYTSHVGLAYRDPKGTLRFLHASKNHGEVVLDSRLSTYLNRYSTHAGIMVARPADLHD